MELQSPKQGICRVIGNRKALRSCGHKNVDASVGDSAKACAMNSSALRTAARSDGPPRQTRTASGGDPSVANASLATTPMPVERMWPTKAERVHDCGSSTHK